MDKSVKFMTFGFEMKEVDASASEAHFTGYASTFGNVDLGLDIVDKGAFKRTLKDNKGKFPILADHSPYDQIGWNVGAMEDEKGLLVEGVLDLNVQKGKERYSLAKKAMEIGAKMGLSIGYMTIKAEPDKENPRIRRLKELKLFEYSFVTFPMNVEAMVTAAKGLAGVDRANFILEHLKLAGIEKTELEQALQLEAAVKINDPGLSQSIDRLISILKS